MPRGEAAPVGLDDLLRACITFVAEAIIGSPSHLLSLYLFLVATQCHHGMFGYFGQPSGCLCA